jgi:hypothetical protein
MRRFASPLLFLIASFTILALPALAGTLTITGTLTSSDPIYQNGRPDNFDCSDQIDDVLPEKYVYQTYTISVTETGTYSYIDLGHQDADVTTIDIEVAFYDGTFNPNSPLNNCIASLDDLADLDLVAGKTYLLSVTSYDVPTTGDYSFSLTGPGDVLFSTGDDEACDYPLPANSIVYSIPSGAPAYYEADAASRVDFDLPAGTWWVTQTVGEFSQVWIACPAQPVWVPTSSILPN